MLFSCPSLVLLVALAPSARSLASPIQGERPPLIVGTKEAAPFSFKADGEWKGISIDLWRGIAEDLERPFELREVPLEGLIDGLVSGELDASVAALTVTPEREERIDFSHPFYSSGLGIATRVERSSWVAVLRRVLSLRFFQAVGTLVVLIFLAGLVIWLFERKKNPAEFGGPASHGLAAGFWWSAVTMTTVGYGDKSPRTGPGRAVALVWMFASVITISGLTATIASTLTVTQLVTSVSGPQDLPSLGRIGTVGSSTSQEYLREARLPYEVYDTPAAALAAMAEGHHQAVVYDAPILRYLVHRDHADTLAVLPGSFQRQDYGIGLPIESELREPLNRALLQRLTSPDWNVVLDEYLGVRQ